MKWSELLADIRTDLKDEAASPKWSNRTLFIYAKDAIRDYSTWFPLRIDRQALTLSNGSSPLPVNFIEDLHVEAPIDTFLEKRQDRPGIRYPASRRFYYISGGKLYADVAELTVYLTYFASHPVPSSEGDDEFVLTIPETDTELLRLYTKGKALGQLRSRQANLDRFKATSGARDDNPLMPETENLYEEYLRGISNRIRGGFTTLYRTGRTK
jgi:hypothetical protein